MAVSLILFALAYPDLRWRPLRAHSIHLGVIRARVARWGRWGPVVSILLMTAHTFIPIPDEILVAVNGAVFGFWEGLAVSWAGAMASASVAFAIGRALGHARTPRSILQKILLWVDTIVRKNDWPVALVIRFIPLFPFGGVDFALGRTPLPWSTFLWTTAVGILPVNGAVVAVGDGVEGPRRVLPWALAVLLGLTILGPVFRSRIARQ